MTFQSSHPVLPLLIERLERVPAESPWARRAGGIRRALLHIVESGENGDDQKTQELIEMAIRLLERAIKGERP